MKSVKGAIQSLVLTGLLLGCCTVPAAKLVLVTGGGDKPDRAPATEVKLDGPFGVAFGGTVNMFIIEMTGNRLRNQSASGIVTIVAGNGQKGDAGDGGPAANAQFNGPHSLAVLPNGDVLVADTWNNRIRQIDAKSGVISTVVGTGEKGFSGDGGPAAKAKFGGLYCATLDPKGERLYLADLDNRRIRMVDLKSGVVTTVAGNGQKGVPKDGSQAVGAALADPRAVAADRKGNIYILERSGNALRAVDRTGKIRTVVGTGQKGASGDGGPARQATLASPKHLCIDLDDNVIIADSDNHLIRKYIPREGKIVRVAGNGKLGTAGLNGPPDQAELNQPHGVCVHPTGTLYISDSSNNRVLKIQD